MAAPESILLPGNRRLTYRIYGASDAACSIFYFHGFPGSRCEGAIWDEAARKLGAAIIAPDRPGFGSTDDAPGRTIGGWASDVQALCSALSIQRCSVIGVSGGGPYALACARFLPDIVVTAQIVSSLAPAEIPSVLRGMAWGNRTMFKLAGRAPQAVHLFTRILGALWARSAPAALAWFRAFVSQADRTILDRPDVRRMMLENIRTAFERGYQGVSGDFKLIAAPWDFSIADISVPTTIWHGLADTYVPPAMSDYLARTIPRCGQKTFPTSGHLLVIEQAEAILQAALAPLKGGSSFNNQPHQP